MRLLLEKELADEINTDSAYLNSHLRESISKLATKDTFNKIKREMVIFFTKNDRVLLTNIVGHQLLFNIKTETAIMSILNVDKKEMNEVFKKSPHFKKFDAGVQLKDQLLFAVPLFILAAEYDKKKMYEERDFIYLITFFKPYTTRVSRYFKYSVNEDRMRNVVENILSDKYDIRKEGNVLGVLQKTSLASYLNYREALIGNTTDAEFHTIFNSGVYTRISNFLKNITDKYMKTPDYLPFEDSSFETSDSESGSDQLSRSIGSDSAVKDSMVKNITSVFIRNPIDQGFITTALKMHTDRNINTKNYRDLLKLIISNVSEKMIDKIPLFFESLFAAFLNRINPNTKRKYSSADLKSPIFITHSMNIFKKSNTKDVNELKVKELLEEMLVNSSDEYNGSKTTKRDIIKKAVFFYMLLMTRK